MDTVRMTIYRGQRLVDFYDVDLDDQIEKHMRWFIGAVADEDGNRVRIAQRDDEGKLINKWESTTDAYFEQFMENLIEELVEERFVRELDKETDKGGRW